MAQFVQHFRPLAWWGAAIVLAAATGLAEGRGPGPATEAKPNPLAEKEATELGIGRWIWTTNFADKQECRLWHSFTLPATNAVRKANLRITADNLYRLYLDGREIGQGGNWTTLTDYDVTWLLTPGAHVLAVEALNDGLEGGVILGLKIQFANGEQRQILSDKSWLIVPLDTRGWVRRTHQAPSWESAKEVGVVGQGPWWHQPVSIYAPPPLRTIELHFWQSGWFQIALVSVALVAVFACVRLAAKLAVQSQAQALLQRERTRIARDLHDDVGAGITQLVLQGEVAQTEFPSGSTARVRFDELCERARTVSHALEEVVWVVNSRRDTLRDFSSYVCKYAQTFLRDTAIRCRLDVESNLPELGFDLAIRRGLLLAVKEALNNVAKYSGASEAHVRVHRRGDTLLVTVEDNGCGFDVTLIGPEGNGLANMDQRLTEMGGQCRVMSQPGAGCRVEFEVSLVPAARGGARRWPWSFRRGRNPDDPGRLGGDDAVIPK